jgi:hypothetical protein
MKGSLLKLLLSGTVLSLCTGTLLTTGCGSSGTRIRYVNAIPNQGGLDFVVDSTTVVTNATYGNAAKYQGGSSGSHTIEVRNTGTETDLINTSVTVQGGADTTYIAEKVAGNNTAVLFTDDNRAPASGDIKLRAINASSTCPVDIYIVPHGTSIGGFSPTWPNVAQPHASPNYLSSSAGTFDIIGTFPGTQFPIAEILNQTFVAGQIRTVVFLDSPQGGLPCSASLILADKN